MFHFQDAVVLPTFTCMAWRLFDDRQELRDSATSRVHICRKPSTFLAPSSSLSLASRISRDDVRPIEVPSALHARDNSEHLGTHRTCSGSTPWILCCLQKFVLFQRASPSPITPHDTYILHQLISLFAALHSFFYHAIIQVHVLACHVELVWSAHWAVNWFSHAGERI